MTEHRNIKRILQELENEFVSVEPKPIKHIDRAFVFYYYILVGAIKDLLGRDDRYYCKKEDICEDAEKSPECSGCVLACGIRHVLEETTLSKEMEKYSGKVMNENYFCWNCKNVFEVDLNKISSIVRRTTRETMTLAEQCPCCSKFNKISFYPDGNIIVEEYKI